MSKRLPRVVIDTCVILDHLLGEDEDRKARARWALAQDGTSHRVVLPAIVLAEVPGAGEVNGDHGGKQARAGRVETVQAWVRDSRFLVAELTERLARQAAVLASEHRMKAADATVLATALAWQCTTLYTRDKNLLKVNGVVPNLTVTEIGPTTAPLFD